MFQVLETVQYRDAGKTLCTCSFHCPNDLIPATPTPDQTLSSEVTLAGNQVCSKMGALQVIIPAQGGWDLASMTSFCDKQRKRQRPVGISALERRDISWRTSPRQGYWGVASVTSLCKHWPWRHSVNTEERSDGRDCFQWEQQRKKDINRKAILSSSIPAVTTGTKRLHSSSSGVNKSEIRAWHKLSSSPGISRVTIRIKSLHSSSPCVKNSIRDKCNASFFLKQKLPPVNTNWTMTGVKRPVSLEAKTASRGLRCLGHDDKNYRIQPHIFFEQRLLPSISRVWEHVTDKY